MDELNPIALYGAILSTIIAISNVLYWWYNSVRLSVEVANPIEHSSQSGALYFVVTNIGRRPTSVKKLRISFFDARLFRRKIGEAWFDHRSTWNPATESVPIPDQKNTSRRVPKILVSGDELIGLADPVADYDPTKHWIRVSAFPRISSRSFHGWAAPNARDKRE